MKHILKFNESADLEVYPNQAEGLKIGATDREAILDEIEAAEQVDDWAKVKELTQKLNLTLESSVLGWSQYSALFESVQEGKAVLQQIADREIAKQIAKNIQPEDTPESQAEQEARIRERVTEKYFGPDSDFEKIKNLLRKEPKYVPAFVRFRYNQGATYATLENLYRTFVDLRDSLDQLPMSVDRYSNLAYSPQTVAPGWELLGDELNKILELRRGRWIVKALPKEAMKDLISRGLWQGQPVDLQEAYKNAPREKQIELLKAAAALEDLNKPKFKELIRRGLSGKPTLDAIIDIIKSTVANANTERGEILERAIAAYPSVAVLYSGENHYVFSFRNDSQLPHLCAKARGWCIQPAWYNPGYADRFWSYANGSLQLGILDFTVDPSSPFHTVGVTIKPNRYVNNLCDQPNSCTSGSDFRQLFKDFKTGNGQHSYPQDLIDAIDENFDAEVSLKTGMDETYKKIKQYSEGERNYDQVLIKTVQGMVKDLATFSNSNASSEDAKVSGEKSIQNQIIASELKNLRNSPELAKAQNEMIREYTDGQKVLASPADVKIFEIFFEGSAILTQDRITTMINKMNPMLAILKNKVKTIPAEVTTPTARKVRILEESFGNAVIALGALKEKIKNQE